MCLPTCVCVFFFLLLSDCFGELSRLLQFTFFPTPHHLPHTGFSAPCQSHPWHSYSNVLTERHWLAVELGTGVSDIWVKRDLESRWRLRFSFPLDVDIRPIASYIWPAIEHNEFRFNLLTLPATYSFIPEYLDLLADLRTCTCIQQTSRHPIAVPNLGEWIMGTQQLSFLFMIKEENIY